MNQHGRAKKCCQRESIKKAAFLTLFLFLAATLIAPAQALGAGDNKFQPGDKAPDFTLKDLSGKDISLSSFAGKKVVLLTFFALRCGTCLMEAPYLEKTYQKLSGEDMTLLSVNTDGVDVQTAKDTMKDVGFKVTYPILLDPDFIASDTYTNFLVPLTLVIDRKGIVRYIHAGFQPGDEKKYEKAIRKAMKR